MARTLNTFPLIPAHRQTVELGDNLFRLRLVWRDRNSAWYVDLFERDGTPLRYGKRLSAEWVPLHEVMDPREDGMIYVVGSGDYEREDLGETLTLEYLDPDELDAAFRSTS